MIFGHSHIFLVFYNQHLLLYYKQEDVQRIRAAVTKQSPRFPSEGTEAYCEGELKSCCGKTVITRIVKSQKSQGGLLGRQGEKSTMGFSNQASICFHYETFTPRS